MKAKNLKTKIVKIPTDSKKTLFESEISELFSKFGCFSCKSNKKNDLEVYDSQPLELNAVNNNLNI